jgi:hypothetical protein
MAIISSPKSDPALAPSEVGSFHSVHPVGTVIDVVCQGLRSQVSSGEVVLGETGSPGQYLCQRAD